MEKNFFKKNILIAGGTGLVGQQLTKQLVDLGANVSVCSLDDESMAPEGIIEYHRRFIR